MRRFSWLKIPVYLKPDYEVGSFIHSFMNTAAIGSLKATIHFVENYPLAIRLISMTAFFLDICKWLSWARAWVMASKVFSMANNFALHKYRLL